MTHPTRPTLAIALALLLTLSGCVGVLPSEQSADEYEVTIVRVIDGDTIEFEYDNGTRDTARLVGIDTPEIHVANEPEDFEGVPDTEAGKDCLRDWGHKASEFVRTQALGETVRLELDEREGPRDRYDRLLAYVYVDGDNLNRKLLEQGYATVYDTDFTKRDSFDEALASAQSAGLGVWECRDPEAVMRSDGPLAVVEVQADAPGDDRENLNGEFVVFENTEEEPLNLTGWTVTDEAGKEYEFPDGFTLDPGEQVTLHTGSGADGGGDLYWGAGSPIWNNGGDTVVVTDADGDVVVEREYGSTALVRLASQPSGESARASVVVAVA